MRAKSHRVIALLLAVSMVLSSCAEAVATANIADDSLPTSDSPLDEGEPEVSLGEPSPAENTETAATEPAADPAPEQPAPTEPAEEPAPPPAEEPVVAEPPAAEPTPPEVPAEEPAPVPESTPEPAPTEAPVVATPTPVEGPTPTPTPVIQAILNEDIVTPFAVVADNTPPTIVLTPIGGEQYHEENSTIFCKGVRIDVSDDVQLASVTIYGNYADLTKGEVDEPLKDVAELEEKEGDVIDIDKHGLKTYVQKKELLSGNGWSYTIESDARMLTRENFNSEIYGRHDNTGTKTIVVTDVEGNEATMSFHIGHYLGRRSDAYNDPTCTEPGQYVQIYTCAVCGEEWAHLKFNETAKALGHTWKAAEDTGNADGSHSHTDGWTYVGTSCQGGAKLYSRTCTVCGFTECEDDKGNSVTALGHHLGKVERKEATCTEDGAVIKRCTNPGCSYTETVTLASSGHVWNRWAVTGSATCTEAGEGTYTCDICGEIKTVTIPAAPHSYRWETTQESTCTAAGSEHQVCTVCGAEGEVRDLPVKAHNLQETIVKAATCTEPGERVLQCVNEGCGHISLSTTIPAAGHAWGEWTVTEQATCQHAGTDTRTCTVDGCGATETRSQPKVGHSYIDDGDCTTPDLCEYCGQRDPKSRQYNTHNYYNAPYHHDENEHWRVCINPGCTVEERAAHTIAGKNDGDCTTDVFCTVCRTTLQKGATSHNMSELISAGEEGHYQKCLNEDCEKHTPIQAHVLNDDGNCLTADSCTLCGAEIHPAQAQHNFGGEWFSDETGHWQKCQNPGCAVTSKAVPHTGEDDDILSTAVVCETCGRTIVAGMTGVDNYTSPVITGVEATADGLRVTWNAVKGADRYRVLYRVGSNEWSTAGDTADTAFTWSDAENGVTYVFSVRCISKDGKYYTSYFDTTGKTVTFNTQPAAPAAKAVAEGVQLQWPAVENTARYRILYKTTGGWQTLADVPAAEYVWTGAQDNTAYTFTVACLSADGKTLTSSYDGTGTAFTYLARPQIATLKATNDGVQVTWNKTRASGYTLLYRRNGGAWEEAADTTTTTYSLTGIESGSTYDLSVEAFDKAGNTSGFDEVGKSIEFFAAPQLPAITCVTEGVQLDWEAVSGAANYRVLYKTGKNAWQTLADTKTNRYLWTGAKHNTAYSFTVACLSDDGTTLTSTYDTAGTALTWLDEATVSAVSLANTGIKVTWAKLAGAKKYRLYYRLGEGEWTQIIDTTATSYTWTGAQAGGTYTFAVQGLDAKGNGGSFGKSGKTKSFACSEQPQLPVITGAPTSIRIDWAPVSGAANYRVLYKIGSGAWKTLADTLYNSYTWTKPASGTTYAFTVACLSADGKTLTSSYNAAGTPFVYLAEPNLTGAVNQPTGVKLTWSKVAGATGYRVYCRTGSEDWTALTDTTATTYTWTGATGGVAYHFDVQAFNKAGNTSTHGNDFKALTYNAQPKLSAVTNTEAGIRIEWAAVPGAYSYRVLYKIGSGAWQTLTETADTSYLWAEGQPGKSYSFTVCGLGSDGTVSSYDTKGIALVSLAQPAVPTVQNLSNGIRVTWTKATGAAKYRLYYRTGGGNWTKLADVSATSYSWTKAQKGTRYDFTLQAVNGNTVSSYDPTGASITYLAQPALPTVANAPTGNKVTWTAVPGSASYKVYGKTGKNAWAELTTTEATEYLHTDVPTGSSYSYTVQAIAADGSASTYNNTGKAGLYLAAPAVPTVQNLSNGIRITWPKATGAAKYRLYYRTGGGNWTKLADVSATSYSWTKAKSNTAYSFSVQAMNGSVLSEYDPAGASITYLAQPALPTVANAPTGNKVTWTAVPGAASYKIYGKTGKNAWAELTTTETTEYLHTDVPTGSSYSYTVQAVAADGSASTYNNTGRAGLYLAAPSVPTVQNLSNGIRVTWPKATGAAKYRLYYRTGGGSWTKLADVSATSYSWTKAKSNTAYSFSVQAMNGSVLSEYDPAGASITYLAQPALPTVANAPTGNKVTWTAVPGAASYKVYGKTGKNAWAELTTTEATEYLHTDVPTGSSYSYTVQAIAADGSASTYNNTGKAGLYLAAPAVPTVQNLSNGIRITWPKATGAAKYRLYYRTGGGNWTKLADVSTTSYSWTKAKTNTTYSFSVQAMNGSVLSEYDPAGASITYLAQPALPTVANAPTGNKVTWTAVPGAASYKVYGKTGKNAWAVLATTDSTELLHEGIASGTSWSYTVQAIAADGSASTYNNTGRAGLYLAAPAVPTVQNLSNGIRITWPKATGAAKYRLYYRTGGGNWTKLADVSATNYTWTKAKVNTAYSFSVQAVNGNTVSAYDQTGATITFTK